jgi:hypothetical protein
MSEQTALPPQDLSQETRPTIPLWPDAGKYIGLGRDGTYAAADRGEIVTVRFGKRRRAVTAALKQMMGVL